MPEPSHSRSISRARRLRGNSTDAEHLLWSKLRNRQLKGIKFRRQVPVPPYTIDFYSDEAMMIIEVDGGQHADSRTDPARDAMLRRRGFTVLRFWNNEVLGNLEGVADTILANLTSPSPRPSPTRERG